MADVLGELFSDIANSIRVGLGTLDEMAPAAFPGKIDEIVELLQNAGTGGGGSGGTEGSSLKIKSGNFHTDANGSRAEVAHGLGTMPDLVIVYIAAAYELEELQNKTGRYLLYTWAIKDSFGTSSHGGYAIPGFHTANVSALNEKSAVSVYCPNDDVFQFGNADTTANGRLMPDTNYFWMAFSGLGAAEPVLQNKTITENGTYTADEGFDGLGEVTVDVAGAGSVEEPMIKHISSDGTATGSAISAHTLGFTLSKDTKILAAFRGALQSSGTTYPNLTQMNGMPLSELTVDTSNANYNKWTVPINFNQPGFSGTFRKTYQAILVVTVPEVSVTSRGDGYYDGKLNYVGNSYSALGKSAFMYMYATTMFFKNFVLADGITKVPSRLLQGQTYLESIDLSNITTIDAAAFNGCAMLKNVDLSNVTSIGSSAFWDCESLTSINLNPNISDIGSGAFNGCTSLTGELVIPTSITKLKRECFSRTKFDRVVFHGGITAFGNDGMGAFQNCTHPTEFDFSAFTSVPTLGYGPWLGVVGSGQVLKIPSALFDTWSTKQYWSDWASQMVAV